MNIKFISIRLLVLFCVFLAPTAQAEWVDISSESTLNIEYPYFDRVSRSYISILDVTYIGQMPMTGVVAFGISESNIPLKSEALEKLADGTYIYI